MLIWKQVFSKIGWPRDQCIVFHPFAAMAEFAQLKVELAKSVEAHTGTQSEQVSIAQRASQLVGRTDHILSRTLIG